MTLDRRRQMRRRQVIVQGIIVVLVINIMAGCASSSHVHRGNFSAQKTDEVMLLRIITKNDVSYTVDQFSTTDSSFVVASEVRDGKRAHLALEILFSDVERLERVQLARSRTALLGITVFISALVIYALSEIPETI